MTPKSAPMRYFGFFRRFNRAFVRLTKERERRKRKALITVKRAARILLALRLRFSFPCRSDCSQVPNLRRFLRRPEKSLFQFRTVTQFSELMAHLIQRAVSDLASALENE